jgi:hypothetical protein
MPSNPFHVAERYIQLKKVFAPVSWADAINNINDMILMPFIVIFLFILRKADVLLVASTIARTYQAWYGFIEYTDTRFQVQEMFIHTKAVGGPFITTNDPTYMPYVFADAVVRSSN